MYEYVAVLSCECHIDTTKWKPLENWSIHQRHIYGSFLICIHVGPSAGARPESVWSLCKDNYYFFFYVAQNIQQHQSILLVVDILIPCYAHIICSSNYSGALQLNERNSSFATSWRTRFLCVLAVMQFSSAQTRSLVAQRYLQRVYSHRSIVGYMGEEMRQHTYKQAKTQILVRRMYVLKWCMRFAFRIVGHTRVCISMSCRALWTMFWWFRGAMDQTEVSRGRLT